MAAVRERDLLFISTADGAEIEIIPNALEDAIKRVYFGPDSSEVLVLGKNCKHVKIYKAPITA